MRGWLITEGWSRPVGGRKRWGFGDREFSYFIGAAGSFCSCVLGCSLWGHNSSGSHWNSVRSAEAPDFALGTERPTWARGLGAFGLTVMTQSSGILYGTIQAHCGPAQAASLNLPPAEGSNPGRQTTLCNEVVCGLSPKHLQELPVLIGNPQLGLRPPRTPAGQAGWGHRTKG